MTTTEPQLASSELTPLELAPCPYCGNNSPIAAYCGACGAHISHHAGSVEEGHHRRRSRRHHSFAAHPGEPVLRLSAVTSLFPHLSERSRAPFRAGLTIVVVLLAVFSLARVESAVVGVSAVGVPILFQLYIYEVDPFEGGFILPTLIGTLVGAGLGVGWALIGSPYVTRALAPSLSSSLTSNVSLEAAVLVPIIGQLLMIVPVALLLVTERAKTETLDGFVAGGSAALGFVAAATFTHLSSELNEGVRGAQPVLGLLTEAGVRGFAVPVIGAMATATIGAAIWRLFRQRPEAGDDGRAERHSRSVLTVLVLAVAGALAVQVGLGFAGLASLSDIDVLLVYLAAAALVIIGARAGIHWLLLTDAHHVRVGPPRICANCHHLVTAMPFCPVCGVAEHATPRSHRRHTFLQHDAGADRDAGADEGATVEWGSAESSPAESKMEGSIPSESSAAPTTGEDS